MECLVSLSWILHGAFSQANYEDHYLMLQILVKNISEENLLEEYICRKSILINVELLLDLTTYQLCLKPELLRKHMLTRGYLKERAKPSFFTETNVSKCRLLGFRVFVSLVLYL